MCSSGSARKCSGSRLGAAGGEERHHQGRVAAECQLYLGSWCCVFDICDWPFPPTREFAIPPGIVRGQQHPQAATRVQHGSNAPVPFGAAGKL
jgi:hypothetical protein